MAANTNPKVLEMVESEIKKNPDISNEELRTKAEGLDKSVSKLTARQFNARYPLQVKRALKPRKRGGRKKAPSRRRGAGAANGAGKSQGNREAIRNVLLDLARDVANASGKGDVVDVIAGMDRYVDRVLKAS